MSGSSRYILGKKINRGGMAEIYLGKQVGGDGFQRLCAIKRILPHYAQDKEFIQMFRDEAHICKRLQHANIVRVEGFEEVEGSYAMIMEFVAGADLRSALHHCEQDRKQFTIPMIAYIVAESARGLHYAHTKIDDVTRQPLGIVHRDISPQNILISFDGEVKVTDFGIADAESKITETRPGIVKGKYSYMSPEQVGLKGVDARTDVFALGIVLWECLAMKRLFAGENDIDTMQRVKNCEVNFEFLEKNQDIDPELVLISRKALEKDVKKRYQSAADLEKDLRRFLSRTFPDYTSDDLGRFFRDLLQKKRTEIASEIKRTLTNNTEVKSKSSKSLELTVEDSRLDFKVDTRPHTSNWSTLKTSTNANNMRQPRDKISSLNQGAATSKVPSSHLRSTSIPYTNPSSRRGKKSRKKTGGLLLLSAAAAIAMLLFTYNFIYKSSALYGPPELSVSSRPERIKLMINDKKINKGSYIDAKQQDPFRIKLKKPGNFRIIAYRAGYFPYKKEIKLGGGDKFALTDIVLKPRLKFAKIIISLKNYVADTSINIGRGYYTATFNKPGQVVAPDLHYAKPYVMRVSSTKDQKTQTFLCRFTPKSIDWKVKNTVTIDVTKKSCSYRGPK